jgi:hypothetical protein
LGPALLLLAAWFLWGPELTDLPVAVSPPVSVEDLSTAPRRTILGDPPVVKIDGFERNCMDCHMLFPASDEPPRKLQQHTDIVLDHGINDRCRNCHDAENRDRLVLESGESISYSEVDDLCAKCHGPTYRDWQRGMHGRTNGYWDASRGEPRKLKCIECHDPHNPRVPAMNPLPPLPPPTTLRMGSHPGHGVEDPVEEDPLRRALQRTAPLAGDAADASAAGAAEAGAAEDHSLEEGH